MVGGERVRASCAHMESISKFMEIFFGGVSANAAGWWGGER